MAKKKKSKNVVNKAEEKRDDYYTSRRKEDENKKQYEGYLKRVQGENYVPPERRDPPQTMKDRYEGWSARDLEREADRIRYLDGSEGGRTIRELRERAENMERRRSWIDRRENDE